MTVSYGWLLRVKITPEDGQEPNFDQYQADLYEQAKQAGLLSHEMPELIPFPYVGPFADQIKDFYLIHFGADKTAADKFSDYIVSQKVLED